MYICVGLFFVLGLVTVVGHGLWLAFALILRGLFGPTKSKQFMPPPPLSVAKPVDEVGITLTQLSRLRQAGLIDPAVHEQLINALYPGAARVAQPAAAVPVADVLQPVIPPIVATPVEAIDPTNAAAAAVPLPLPLPPAHPISDIAARHRAAHGLPPASAVATAIPPKPAKPLSQVLASFMQQNNIRWGELIGGLLIIGGSAALVVSFWTQIAQTPILKFSLFTAVTAALFGIGLYSEHRWKLATTSRGVLLIATLLIPLNCLALAAFSAHGEAAGFALAAQAIAILLFSWLLWMSAKILAPQWPALLTVGTITISAFMLLAPADANSVHTLQLATTPVSIYVGACAVMLRRARRWKAIRAPAAEGIFLALGVFTFATVLGLLLLISRGASGFTFENAAATLRTICSVISGAGLPALTAGLLIWQRSKGRRSNAIRIAGGAIAIIGGGILLLGVALGWPQPSAMVPVALLDFVALLVIAFLYELPALLLLSIPCLAVAWLVGFHVIARHIAWHDATGAAADVLLLPSGGTAFAPFTVLLALGAALLVRRKPKYAKIIALMATCAGVLTVLLLNTRGFGIAGDPYRATWVYLAFALAMFAGRWVALNWLADAAWFVLFAAFAQFFISRNLQINPWAISLFAWASVAAIAFAGFGLVRKTVTQPFRDIRYFIAIFASVVGAALLCEDFAHVPLALLWLAGIWLIVSIGARQILLTTTAMCAAIIGLYIRAIHPAPTDLTALQVIHLLSLNATAIALLALITSWFGRRRVEPFVERWEVWTQIVAASVLFALIVGPATLIIAVAPAHGDSPLVGDGWTWLAALALGVALFGRQKFQTADISISKLAIAAVTLAMLVACTVNYLNTSSWNSYHVLLTGCVAAGWIVVGYGVWIGSRLLGVTPTLLVTEPLSDGTLSYHQPAQSPADVVRARATMMFGKYRLQPQVIFWAIGLIVAVVVISGRGALDDPAAPWWAVGAIVTAASLLPMLASWACRPVLLYPASLLINLAASIWYAHRGYTMFTGSALPDFVLMNVIVLALTGIAWLVLDVHIFRAANLTKIPGPHRSVALMSIIATAVLTAFILIIRFTEPVPGADVRLYIAAVAAIAALATACLWDRGATYVLATLYSVGLLAIAAGFAVSTANGKTSAWQLSLVVSGFALLTGILWAVRRQLAAVARVVAIPVDARTWPVDWLPSADTFLVLVTVVIAYWVDLVFPDPLHRIAPAGAAIAGGFALALLALGNLKVGIRQSALGVFALSAVAFAWALMSPGDASILDRAVAVFVVLAALSAIYVLVIPRVVPAGSTWISVAAGEGLHLSVVAGFAVVVSLGIEVWAFVTHTPIRISGIDIGLLLAALLASCVTLLLVAIRQKNLPGRVRSACVFAAEAMLALAFLHLRVSMPQLFGGVFSAYWPLVLMAIAFAGVGAAEVLRRKFDAVLVRPIEQSGIFLPLLPVLAFWLAPPRSVNFGELLLTVAFFYGVVSALRRSFIFAIVGVLAANGALWFLLTKTPGWAFNEHPQVWLIPGAVAVLIAAQFNRSRMSAEQMRAIRYACLLVIYASSTADVFLNGVSTHPWLPLLLAGLSVVGALLGIVLRIRPFLYLGTTFLSVSILTMIYYASKQLQWTWIWYVAAIVVGGGIMILFGLFEKKRSTMIGFVESLRKWE